MSTSDPGTGQGYESPYAEALGIEIESLDAERALLRLPFREANANPGGALHGGVAASLSVIGVNAVTRAALGAERALGAACRGRAA